MLSIDPVNEPLVHSEDMRAPTDLRVDADGEDESVVVFITPLELFFPLLLDIERINVTLLLKPSAQGYWLQLMLTHRV